MPIQKKHDFTRQEIMAGALVLSAAAVFFGFIAVIQGLRPARETATYHAQFSNTIGLKTGAEVRFGGMMAGLVSDISPDPESREKIRVTVAVDPGLPVNAESIATIEQISLTTDKHLEISTGKDDAPLHASGAVLKSVTKSGGFVELPNMDGLVSGSEDLIGDLRDLLGVQIAKTEEESEGKKMPSLARIAGDVRGLLGVEEAAQQEAAGGVEMASVARVTQDVRDLIGVQAGKAEEAAGGEELIVLTDITAGVDGLFKRYQPQLDEIVGKVSPMQDSVQALLDELNAVLSGNRENLDKTLENVAGIVEKLNAQLEGLLAQLSGTLENTEGLTGDLSAFVAANRPVLENMLGDLTLAVQNLGVFMQELKNQPQSVVWGKPAQGRK